MVRDSDRYEGLRVIGPGVLVLGIMVAALVHRGCSERPTKAVEVQHSQLQLTVPPGTTWADWTGLERAAYRRRSRVVWRFRATHDALKDAQVYIQQMHVFVSPGRSLRGSAPNRYHTYYPLDRLKPKQGKPLGAEGWKVLGRVEAYGQVFQLERGELRGCYVLFTPENLYMLYYRLPAATAGKRLEAREALLAVVESLRVGEAEARP